MKQCRLYEVPEYAEFRFLKNKIANSDSYYDDKTLYCRVPTNVLRDSRVPPILCVGVEPKLSPRFFSPAMIDFIVEYDEISYLRKIVDSTKNNISICEGKLKSYRHTLDFYETKLKELMTVKII